MSRARAFAFGAAVVMGGCGVPAPLPAPVAVADPASPRVENPQYLQWAAFAPGSRAVTRAVTERRGRTQATTTTTTTLATKTDESLTVETTTSMAYPDGRRADNSPERFAVPRWIRLPPPPEPAAETGPEEVRAAGQTIACEWAVVHTVGDMGKSHTRTWTSDRVPGNLVKSVTETPSIGESTALELVEFHVAPKNSPQVSPDSGR